MGKKLFTEEQQQLLRQNPYVYCVTGSRLQLTREFKELFLTAYNAGEYPREILINYGFDIGIIGERRVWSISSHIRTEYEKYGEFHEGYSSPRQRDTTHPSSASSETDGDKLRKLQHDVDYLKQEIEFLKKISSIRNTRK